MLYADIMSCPLEFRWRRHAHWLTDCGEPVRVHRLVIGESLCCEWHHRGTGMANRPRGTGRCELTMTGGRG
jgi:hypothetical protein